MKISAHFPSSTTPGEQAPRVDMQELVKNIPPPGKCFFPQHCTHCSNSVSGEDIGFLCCTQRGSLIFIVATCDRCPDCTMCIICTYSVHMWVSEGFSKTQNCGFQGFSPTTDPNLAMCLNLHNLNNMAWWAWHNAWRGTYHRIVYTN